MQNIPGLVVILGSPNDSEGNLSEMGRGRVATGHVEYLARRDAGWKILLTGGYGHHFNTTDKPNAFYAKQILLEQGVPESEIVEFAESKDTVDDALQARRIIQKYKVPALVVVSSDFHLDRVKYIFREIFPHLELSFSGAEYLPGRPREEAENLRSHENKELESLRTTRRSKLMDVALDP